MLSFTPRKTTNYPEICDIKNMIYGAIHFFVGLKLYLLKDYLENESIQRKHKNILKQLSIKVRALNIYGKIDENK